MARSASTAARRPTRSDAPRPVYALVGGDAFLQIEALREVLAQLPGDAQRIDVDGERAELSEVVDELRSFSMFGGIKVLVVRNADALISQFRAGLEKYVDRPVDSAVLVLRVDSLPANTKLHKMIARVGQLRQCAPPRDLGHWITGRARDAHRMKLLPEAAQLLAEMIGPDLARLDNELAKLALSTNGPGRIDADAVRRSVVFQREQEMWEMTGELARGNVAAAVRRWRQLVQLDASTEYRAVAWLTMWLQDVSAVLAARSGRSPMPNIAWRYRDRWAQFQHDAQAMGESGVARALDLLTETDRRSKSGIGDAASNVERFLLTVRR